MNLDVILYVTLLITSILIGAILLVRLLRLWDKTGAPALILIVLSVALWSFGYALEILVPELDAKAAWANFEYIWIALLPLGVIVFFLRFTGRGGWLSPTRIAILCVIPVVTILLTYTNQYHGLMYTDLRLPESAIGPLTITHGIWFNIQAGYSYLLLLLSAIFALNMTARGAPIYRVQARLALAAMLVPWVANFLYLSGLNPFGRYDLTPLAFTLTNILLEIAFSRFGLVDRLPVAYAAVFASMSDGVIIVNEKDNILEINPAGKQILGDRGETAGMNIREIFPEWDSWKNEAGTPGEIVRDVESGSRTYLLRTAPILSRRQRVIARVLLLTDVTAEKRAQATMLLQSTALAAAQNGIVITDRQGTIQWANPAFSALTGYSVDEAISQNPKVLKSGKHDADFYQEMWSTILSGQMWRGEIVNRRKNGSLYSEEMTITPLVQQDGSITHFIAIKQDITVRKEAEAALRQAHDEAIQANRLKTQLLANVSHDLRTPLGAIIGYAEMLQSGVFGELNEEQKLAGRDILDSSNQLLTFINNLIGQAQIETGRIILHSRPLEMIKIVEEVYSTIRYHTTKKGLDLAYEIAPDLPDPLAGDDYWLKQILLNLVNNAVKFTDQGSITTRIYAPDRGHWAIQVSDTGIGIPGEHLERIFSPFQQVDGSPTRRRGGSGLGLSIVKQLAEAMNGSVSVESHPGEGAKFTVVLPVITAQE